MDQEVLVSDDVRSGAELLAALQKRNFPVTTAFWVPMDDSWRFVIVTPLVDQQGLRPTYGIIGEAIDEVTRDRDPFDPLFTVDHVTLYGEQEPRVEGWMRHAQARSRDRRYFWSYDMAEIAQASARRAAKATAQDARP